MNKVKTVGVNYLNEVVRLSLEVCVIIWLLKTKKRDNLSTLSRFVPLTLPTSNSFYENVDELYALKETLIQQGILNGEGNGLALARD